MQYTIDNHQFIMKVILLTQQSLQLESQKDFSINYIKIDFNLSLENFNFGNEAHCIRTRILSYTGLKPQHDHIDPDPYKNNLTRLPQAYCGWNLVVRL